MTSDKLFEWCCNHDCSAYSNCDLCMYDKGRADKYQEITSEYMLLTEKQVAEIRADAIDKVIKCLEAEFLMQNNPNSKFVKTIVLHRDFIDALEQLKEQNDNNRIFKSRSVF